MAIAKMNKFTLLTFHAHKEALLGRLQVFGDVHLSRPDGEELSFLRSDFSQEQISHWEIELEKVRFATAKLASHAPKTRLGEKRPTLSVEEFERYTAQYDFDDICRAVREQDEAITEKDSEIQRRLAENDALIPWQAFDASPADLAGLRATGYLLGTLNKQVLEEMQAALTEQFPDCYIEHLDTVKEDASLLLLFPAEQYDELNVLVRERGFTRLGFQLRGVPADCVRENLAATQALRAEQESARAAIEALAPEYHKLLIAQDYFETVLERERARGSLLASDTTILMEGWVPCDDSEELERILDEVCPGEYYLALTEVEKDSAEVPIKLKNNTFVRAFESITSMYSMPRYNEIDPTPLLAPFYWLFFGMMVGDIGYGALMLVGTSAALALLDLKESMKDFMRFFRYLSISVMGAGVLYGSCFGVTVFAPIANGDGTYRAILDTQESITTMLVLSIAIGIIHILFGLSIKAYMGFRDGKPLDGFCDGILWMITLLSAIGWLLGATGLLVGAGDICKWIFIACLVGLAATQGRASPTIGGKIGNGLYGVYGLTSYVGDIVSYTRIVALALSGAYIAYAFNMMTGLVAGEFGASGFVVGLLRLLAAVVVLLLGQALNFGLALLGAYVHTCRLQYVEYFGKFYEGGGVVFRPLSLKNEYVHIK